MAAPTPQPLLGKIALVTDCSLDIGLAIAHRLVLDGANVVINYVSNDAAVNQMVASLNVHRANSAVAVKSDLSSVEQAKYLWKESVKAFSGTGAGEGGADTNRRVPEILILNEGMNRSLTLSEIDEEFYDEYFNANVKGPLFLVKEAAPSLVPGSRIIFFSSSLAHASMVPATALVYAAGKGAIEQVTRVLAKDLGANFITVNCVAPGPVDTPFFHLGRTEQQIGFFTNLHPQKRLGETEEVANVVAFLVGPGATWINGQTIMVNGAFVV